ncbi:MAG: glycosyl transferase family 1 [Ilumatobacteraceae bacterium]|nr:glycosyl transferase family 1 [Ilumatobacteraceae bacterium]
MNKTVSVVAKPFVAQLGGESRAARMIYGFAAENGYVVRQVGARKYEQRGRRGKLKALAWEATFASQQLSASTDVVHFPSDTFLFPRIPKHIPVVSSVYGMASLSVPHVRTRMSETFWRFRVKSLTERSDVVITSSQKSADDLQEFAATPIATRVIYLGVDHDLFRPGEPDALLLSAMALPANFCLYVGNLDPRKNLIELIAAFETPQIRALGCPLVISGRPAWDADEILAAIARASNSIYLGRRSDEEVVSLMRASKAFVFPSLYEGFGLPVVEAMATGTPVICTSRGSLHEIASGAAQILSGPERDDIVDGLLALLPDEQKLRQFRSLGLERASRFTWEAAAASFFHVLNEVTS